MSTFKTIQNKLEEFIKKYYINELIKGVILFFSIGLLYFLITLSIESLLWLNTTSRAILFWLFIAVEVALFYRFIALPLAKLFHLKQGINTIEASKLIGDHFPEVNDKLLNVLQLHSEHSQSELLLASIDQKSEELSPIPFKLAVNFKQNLKYLKYAAIPLVIIIAVAISGKLNWFSDSYERVVNYKTAYEAPAPFQFYVLNDPLTTTENQSFTLIVKTDGEVIPETAQIEFNSESYFLKQQGSGAFEFVFEQPKSDISFRLNANGVYSKPYTLQVVEVPTLLSFDMALDYPSYTNKPDEVIRSSGNAVLPQGTKVTWTIQTKATENVHLYSSDTLVFTAVNPETFQASKQLFNGLDYSISTSNSNLKDYENLAFNLAVIKDQYPELSIETKVDSLDLQTLYFYGKASDDYGISKLRLVYYPVDNEVNKEVKSIPIAASNYAEFITAFPNDIDIKEGIAYELYFEVFDNDGSRRPKSTKSSVFTYRKRTQSEEEQKQLKEQNETIQGLDKALDKFDKQQKELEQLSKTQKEKSELNFNDKKKLDQFIKRQKQQEEMMQEFNKKLKDNLDDFQKENKKEDPFKEDLKERLKENEEQLKRDEKLLEELKKIQDKISKEELSEKIEKLSKQNKSQKRSLQQILELTKRYYVSKKMEKIAEELQKLGEKQEALSNKDSKDNTKEKQDKLNDEFKQLQEEMDQLQKENSALKQPLKLPRKTKEEAAITREQNQASESLEKKENAESSPSEQQESQKNAQQKQKNAAQKMKEMGMQMQQQMGQSGQESLEEDMTMLRQILDNLLLFSFDEEAVMNDFRSIETNHNEYAKYLKKQKDLRTHFEHVDDSLFALSLRQPKISEQINNQIYEVYFNVDKALDQLAENNIYHGVSAQQYAVTSANNLANMLSTMFDSMQMQMIPSPGQGSGDMPLPDIIMSQEELNEQMKDGMKKGEQGQPKEGDGPKPGEQGTPGKEGESGKEGQEGKSGEDGTGGESGKGGKDGKGQGNGEGSQGLDGFNEDLNGELYQIYQEQQRIREALEDRLEKDGIRQSREAKQLLKDMENVELDLINKGFTNQTLSKMMNLQHQLLKLENATFQQGQDTKRKADTNTKTFENTTQNQIPKAKEYFNSIEILNKQTLPLQPIYKEKVQNYFKIQTTD
ncbi:DUF4175 family protein [Bizionia paragorgiae]|uniref:Collagen triple helix repeat-containing protein n=1 Tax=Bizionia paragorgiae TaxID=283786 RepID=A0A1H3W3B2_BIZPA|nr:DUF4175 family protein [Bizionia paragorgiae]SDZ81569.1 hypothetical protein SAMN04487990_102203 [Bizionia paragorgiae]